MNKSYAIVGPDNRAINFIIWDGVTEFDYGQSSGNFIVSLTGIASYGFGWLWNGSSFYDPTPSAPVLVPEVITRRQCALQLLEMGMISDTEAVEMARVGDPPANIKSYIDALPTASVRARAMIDFAADNYYRNNYLLDALKDANGITEEEMDNFFIDASQL
jgi:hypothetical protein